MIFISTSWHDLLVAFSERPRIGPGSRKDPKDSAMSLRGSGSGRSLRKSGRHARRLIYHQVPELTDSSVPHFQFSF